MTVLLHDFFMRDEERTSTGELFQEVGRLRQRVEELESAEARRRQAEQVLRESEERLRLLLESTDDVVAMQDLEGRYLFHKGPDLFGLTNEEVVGKTPADILDAATAAGIMVRIRHVAESGRSSTFEQRATWKNETYWFLSQISPVFNAAGNVSAVATFARNITERKRAEESLRAANILLERTFAALKEAVFVINPSTQTIVACNSAVEHIFGYRPEEVTGRTTEFLHVDRAMYEEFTGGLSSALEQDSVFNTEFRMRRKDGRIIFTEHTVTETVDDARARTGLVSVVRNITERKKMEEDLLNARKLESIGVFAGGIAHDFNNLLSAILGNIAFARMYVNPDNKASGRLDDAEKACVRAGEVTNQLITFACGGSPVKRTTLIGELIEETVRHCMEGSRVTCHFDLACDLWPVEIDEEQIRTVIHNITLNAREAMPQGGAIAVRAANVTMSAKDELPLKKWKHIEISIEDHGVGILEENLPKIFDPYFTTKELTSRKGMGLGLALCYSIVRKHGGDIRAESRVGSGTTFFIYLPVSTRESMADTGPVAIRPDTGNNARFMEADDTAGAIPSL